MSFVRSGASLTVTSRYFVRWLFGVEAFVNFTAMVVLAYRNTNVLAGLPAVTAVSAVLLELLWQAHVHSGADD